MQSTFVEVQLLRRLHPEQKQQLNFSSLPTQIAEYQRITFPNHYGSKEILVKKNNNTGTTLV
jgi:hypothetical protein